MPTVWLKFLLKSSINFWDLSSIMMGWYFGASVRDCYLLYHNRFETITSISVSCIYIQQFNIGRHHPVCLLVFGIQKELPRRKYFYSEKELAANFHLMWFISLFLLSLLIYPLIYLYLLVVRVLRYILSLTTENHLMNG